VIQHLDQPFPLFPAFMDHNDLAMSSRVGPGRYDSHRNVHYHYPMDHHDNVMYGAEHPSSMSSDYSSYNPRHSPNSGRPTYYNSGSYGQRPQDPRVEPTRGYPTFAMAQLAHPSSYNTPHHGQNSNSPKYNSDSYGLQPPHSLMEPTQRPSTSAMEQPAHHLAMYTRSFDPPYYRQNSTSLAYNSGSYGPQTLHPLMEPTQGPPTSPRAQPEMQSEYNGQATQSYG